MALASEGVKEMTFTMKKILATTGSLLLLVLAACSGGTSDGSQQAALANGTNQVQAHGHDPARFLQHFDKNGDGKVEVAELPERMQDRLGKADANKDGVISADELSAHFAAMKAQMFKDADKNSDGSLDATEVGADRWAHISPADADKDGKVTQSELDAARASGAIKGFHGDHGGPGRGGPGGEGGRGFHHGPPPSVDEMIAKLDANKDGILQTSEIPERMRPWISKADTNNDGQLTKTELEAARAAREAQKPAQ